MSNFVTYVLTRIDLVTKKRTTLVLEAIDLSVSKAIRLFMLYKADEHRLADGIKIPNNETRTEMAKLEAGKGISFDSVDALIADLQADD
ncbi:MAG: type II toxin-antitoxin system RelB/DinJ family antitoxin [Rhodobacteraceae bacterium]|nr:type II toxin-antitoxin system RelB/DinJ family antitoxin [Paracoccaceae bacterium]